MYKNLPQQSPFNAQYKQISANLQNQILTTVRETVNGAKALYIVGNTNSHANSVPETISTANDSVDYESSDDIINRIGKENGLNTKQWVAYRLICNRFLDLLISRKLGKESTFNLFDNPLRLFMTGPGGTGKTHVVKCVQQVMKVYGCEHQIRFMAPTGTAASLINGTTCHKGLGLSIKKKVNRFLTA